MKHLSLFFCLLWAVAIQAQVKIGDAPENILPGSLLELESNDRTLVITRVNTAQMNLITASEGALVYNTDVNCVHYYNGTAWVNICDAVAGSVTFSSGDGTIIITSTGNNHDFKVGEIDGKRIMPGTIGGTQLGDGSVSKSKMMRFSVENSHLSDEVVGKGLRRDTPNDNVSPPGPLEVNAGRGLTFNSTTGALEVDATTSVTDWTNLTNIPSDIADGDDDTTYTAGAGITLTGNDLSVDDLIGEVTGPTTATVIADNTITSAKIVNGTIEAVDLNQMGATNDQVLKWNGTAWIPATDAAGAAYTAGAGITLTGNDFSVDDLIGEVTGPTTATVIADNTITSAKIINGAIINEDISSSAAIVGTKINPDFGSQNILTTGSLGAGTNAPTSTLHTGGSFSASIIRTTIDLTLDNTHYTIILGGDLTITLPPASSCTGRIYIIKNPGHTATISPYFDSDAAPPTLPSQLIPPGVIQLQSDGTNWQQIN